MTNRSCVALLLLACFVALTASANAQVFVLSHTTVENGLLKPECETQMRDATTIALYPDASAFCTLIQNGAAVQAFPGCFGSPQADCTYVTGPEIEGADYETITNHGLVLQVAVNSCTQNGVLINCLWDPLSYGLSSSSPVPAARQFKDNGLVPFSNFQSFWTPDLPQNDILIGVSTETQFQTAQVVPSVLHLKAGDTQLYRLNGNQNANWTFIGTAGTTSPTAPSQGTSITFIAPNTVPVQQVDTLTGCKVDVSHGTDCNSAQIIVEVLGVSIPPSDWTVTPPSNPDELLGGQSVHYNATVTQGGQVVNIPVTWAKTAETSGGSFVTVDPGGTVTVQPQSAFQGADFTVSIQATSTIDPKVAVSGPFAIHVPTATVQMTTVPVPGVNEANAFEAIPGRAFDFAAQVTGPLNPKNQQVAWSQKNLLVFFGDPGKINPNPDNPNAMSYVISSPPPPGVNIETVTISACVGGTVDLAGNLVGAQCATFPLKLAPPVFPTSPPQQINSGESTAVTITGTGFGSAPALSFADPNITFTPSSITGPDANGVTTIVGTMAVLPIAADETTTMTITSSLPPPSTPGTQLMTVRGVTLTPSVTPSHPSLILTQSQQFTPSLGCVTLGGQACTVPQTFTCSIVGVGVMNPSTCVYTAPSSLIHESSVTARACSTFGAKCVTFFIDLVPVTIAVTPTAASLDSGQSQQFQSTVTNVPNNNQGTIWSISPAVGSISAAGLYIAPALVTTLQTVTVSGCSVVDSSRCASAAVTLNPVAVAIAPGSVTLGQGQTQQFQATVTHSTNTGVVWTISPAVGSITTAGLYTAPPSVTGNQAVVVKVCSSIAPANCATSTVNLVPPDFALSVSPSSISTGLGFKEGATVSITPINAFSGPVTLTATLPAGIGMSSSFSIPIINGSGTSVATFPVTSSTPVGNYVVTITGTSGGLVHSAQITVTVVLESITVTMSAPQTAAAGATVTFTFNVANNNFFAASDSINFTGIPPGSTIPPIAWGGSGPGSLVFTTPTTLSPGTYPITLTASVGALTGSASTSLTIPAPPPAPPPPPPKCTTRDCLNQ